MGSNLSTAQTNDGASSGHRPASPNPEWVCHCNADPKPVAKAPRVLGDDERFHPQESRPMRCALCPYVESGHWHHCLKCWLSWEEDPASHPTRAEIEEVERKEVEEGYQTGCCLFCTGQIYTI